MCSMLTLCLSLSVPRLLKVSCLTLIQCSMKSCRNNYRQAVIREINYFQKVFSTIYISHFSINLFTHNSHTVLLVYAKSWSCYEVEPCDFTGPSKERVVWCKGAYLSTNLCTGVQYLFAVCMCCGYLNTSTMTNTAD